MRSVQPGAARRILFNMEPETQRRTLPYYYANGQKIKLEPVDEFRAIDPHRIRSGTKLRRDVEKLIRDTGSRAYRNVSIVPTEAVPVEMSEELSTRNAFQPVYKRGDSMMIFLPEVRIEEDRPEYRKKIQSMLKKLEPDLSIDQRSYRTKVKPKSGRGADALDLANEIQETVAPDFVQARMLRVTPRRAR